MTCHFKSLPILFLLLLAFGCSGSGSAPPTDPGRSFGLAFTPWPYDATQAAVNFSYAQIQDNADWVAHHLDQGVPWQEAFDSTPYPQGVQDELDGRIAATPIGHKVYLAITPLNGARDGLADNWANAGAEPLSAPWDTRQFDDAEVVQAFSNYALDLIGRFQPDCLNFAVEVSELALNKPTGYQSFLLMAPQVIANIRMTYPNLPLMVSIALKSPGSADATTLLAQMPAIVAMTDWVGVSVYPYAFYDHADKGDPANLPSDWLSQISALAGTKPIAIAETGWIAEDLSIPAFGLSEMSDAQKQNAYLTRLFAECDALDARFITWFTVADYDLLWSGALGSDPLAQIWRDTGLYDGLLAPRISLQTWQAQLARPTRP